jgi:serine/threonine protein kinase
MAATDPFGWVGSSIEGQFAVDRVAGEGGFGVVYRGTHLGFGAPVAIKCLKVPDGLGSEQREQLLARFQAEAGLLHRLSRLTTGVVQALHVGAAQAPSGSWTPYIVMEWLDGETLESDLARRAAGPGPRPSRRRSPLASGSTARP